MEVKELRKYVHARVDRLDEAQLQGLALILDSMAQAVRGEPEAIEPDLTPSPAHSSRLTEAEKLYYRSLADLLALQTEVGRIRESLRNKDRFLEMMDKKGKDVAWLQQSLQFAHSLDRALEAIVNLMQYDERTRPKWDIRNGFQFRSGSMNFVRWYFGQPEVPTEK